MSAILPRVMDGFDQSIGRVVEFDRIVEFYRPRVFRFALASLRDRDAAETVAQDCFLKAHAAYGSFRGDCSLQTWLMGITINLIRDQLRNRRLQFWRRTRSTPVAAEDYVLKNARAGERSPEAMASLKQQVASVWAAAELLPDRQRCVFLLRFVEDMDILEIGAATGMKEGTVKQHLFRALQAVRQRMGSSL
jgi:RNA polymerase sigma-70 factor (ECF subfamily)